MSESQLHTVMKRIIGSNYTSMKELVKDSNVYSIDELHDFLNHIITKWEANELTPASISALLRFVYVYLDRPDIQIRYKNCIPIPICYFTLYLPLGTSTLYSFLKTGSIAVTLFSLSKTDRDLKEFIKKMKPPVVLFALSHFLHVETFKQLVPYLQKENPKIIAGGIPFVYDENLKRGFPDCVFPENLTELTLSLETCLKGDAE